MKEEKVRISYYVPVVYVSFLKRKCATEGAKIRVILENAIRQLAGSITGEVDVPKAPRIGLRAGEIGDFRGFRKKVMANAISQEAYQILLDCGKYLKSSPGKTLTHALVTYLAKDTGPILEARPLSDFLIPPLESPPNCTLLDDFAPIPGTYWLAKKKRFDELKRGDHVFLDYSVLLTACLRKAADKARRYARDISCYDLVSRCNNGELIGVMTHRQVEAIWLILEDTYRKDPDARKDIIRRISALLSGRLEIIESNTDDMDVAGIIQLETNCELSVALNIATVNRIAPDALRIACSRPEYEPLGDGKAAALLGRTVEIYVPYPLRMADDLLVYGRPS